MTAEAERLLAAAVDVRPGPVVDLTDAQLDLLISWVDRVIAVAATRDVARLLDAVGEVPTDGEVGPRLVLTEAMDVVSAEACEALGRAADWGDDTAARLVGEAGQWLAVLAMLTAADSID